MPNELTPEVTRLVARCEAVTNAREGANSPPADHIVLIGECGRMLNALCLLLDDARIERSIVTSRGA